MEQTCRVTRVEICRDGGSTAIRLEGEDGESIALWFDYAIGTETRGRLFVLASETSLLNRRLVPLNSPEQQSWLAALRKHVDSRFTSSKQADILHRADAWGHGLKFGEPFTADEYDSWLILDRVHNLELLSPAQ